MSLCLESVKDYRLYPLYVTALITGLSRGELPGLRWRVDNIGKKQITILQTMVQTSKGKLFSTPKTAAPERTIDVFGKVMKLLDTWQVKQKEEMAALGVRPDHDLEFSSDAVS